MKKIPNEKIQRICELRQEGLTETQIAQHEDVQVSQPTVSKHLKEQKYIKEIRNKDKQLKAAKTEIVGLKATISLIETDLQAVKSKIEEIESSKWVGEHL